MYITELEQTDLMYTVRKIECHVSGKHLKPVVRYGMNICDHCLSSTDIPIEN